jgi:hypothetical protein
VDLVLVTITVASLMVAAVTSFVAWRLARDERERSAARVAALEAAADAVVDVLGFQEERRGSPAPVAGAVPLAAADAVAADVPVSRASGLFASAPVERAMLARVGPALLAGVLIVGSVIALAVGFSGEHTASAADRNPRPLELLSLRHAIQDGTLNVTGLVRNPAQNPELTRLTAVVFLFDGKGSFVGSGRVPLDFAALAPGEESPFVVSLSAPSGVARYRVSFRRDEGGVIPHVDRRETRVP